MVSIAYTEAWVDYPLSFCFTHSHSCIWLRNHLNQSKRPQDSLRLVSLYRYSQIWPSCKHDCDLYHGCILRRLFMIIPMRFYICIMISNLLCIKWPARAGRVGSRPIYTFRNAFGLPDPCGSPEFFTCEVSIFCTHYGGFSSKVSWPPRLWPLCRHGRVVTLVPSAVKYTCSRVAGWCL